jgi:FkbM family methyltransferase
VAIVQGLISNARLARLVGQPITFFVRQARRAPGPYRYRVRGTGITVHIRHGTPDINSLDQIFRLGHYEVPPEVEATLRNAPRPLKIVDLGANVGLFSAYAVGAFGDSEITVVEPDPANVDVLTRTATTHGWRVVAACAGVRDTEVPFTVGNFTNSRVEMTSGDATVVVPAVDVFQHLSGVDLLKIDIEGSEWAILEDDRLNDVAARAVALEYHAHLCPAADPRSLAHELLRRAGYTTLEREDFDAPCGHGMIWAWKDT